MSEGTVRQCRRMFSDGRTNVHDEEWSGRPAICSEWWSCSKCRPESLWKKALHNFRTFLWISTNLYEIITIRLGYHKFWARWVPKMLAGAYKMQRMASSLTFFRAIPQRLRWISQSHHTSNRWWNLGFICECWNHRAVKSVDAHTFTKQAKNV
jgi:hypothetical protein